MPPYLATILSAMSSHVPSVMKSFEQVVVDHRRHAGDVAGPLALADALGRPLPVELLEDERVVGRRPVEGHLHPGHLAPPRALLVGVADAQEGRAR